MRLAKYISGLGALFSALLLIVMWTVPVSSAANRAVVTATGGGYCTVKHGLNVVPTAIQLTPRVPLNGQYYNLSTVAATFTSSTFQLRAVNLDGTPDTGAAITFWITASNGSSTFGSMGSCTTDTVSPSTTTTIPTTTTTIPPTTMTTVPPTTTTTTVPPTTTVTIPPPPSGFPNSSNTGFPASQIDSSGNWVGVTVNGDLFEATPGAVIDGVHITGSLIPAATGIVVKNSWIEGSVNNDDHQSSSVSVTDTTVGPNNGCISEPGLWSANITALRVHVQGHDNGFQLAAGGAYMSVTDSYADVCANPPVFNGGSCVANCPDGSHSDGFQAYCPSVCNWANFQHDTLKIENLDYTTASFFAGAGGGNGWPKGDTTHPGITLDNSLLIGGAFTLYEYWDQGLNYEIHGNTIARQFTGNVLGPNKNPYWDFGPTDNGGTCAHQNWSGNVTANVDANFNISSPTALACG